jgi:hypothetical protein
MVMAPPVSSRRTETFEKWLRRVSKIFSAKKMIRCNHDILKTVSILSGKAENI